MYIRFAEEFAQLDPADKKILAVLVGTSVMTLRHYAAGRYKMSAERAIAVVNAMHKMGFSDARKSWCRPDLFNLE
jgi:hypothetical protein